MDISYILRVIKKLCWRAKNNRIRKDERRDSMRKLKKMISKYFGLIFFYTTIVGMIVLANYRFESQEKNTAEPQIQASVNK